MFDSLIKDITAQKVVKLTFITILKALLLNQSVQLISLYRLGKCVGRIRFIGGPLSKLVSYISRVIIPSDLNVHSKIAADVYFPHSFRIALAADLVRGIPALSFKNNNYILED